ncbi:unnamed protein product, partial [Trichobilharzia regenti]
MIITTGLQYHTICPTSGSGDVVKANERSITIGVQKYKDTDDDEEDYGDASDNSAKYRMNRKFTSKIPDY